MNRINKLNLSIDAIKKNLRIQKRMGGNSEIYNYFLNMISDTERDQFMIGSDKLSDLLARKYTRICTELREDREDITFKNKELSIKAIQKYAEEMTYTLDDGTKFVLTDIIGTDIAQNIYDCYTEYHPYYTLPVSVLEYMEDSKVDMGRIIEGREISDELEN